MKNEIKKLEKLVGEFDFMLQDGFIMSPEEYEHTKNLAKQLSETIRDFFYNDPRNKDKIGEFYMQNIQ